MFRHVALFRFLPDSTAEQRQAVARRPAQPCPPRSPSCSTTGSAPTSAITEGNFDFAVVADFAEPRTATRRYRDHPAHEAVASTSSGRSWPTGRRSSTSC